jgi:hypothetical protein
MSHYEDCSGENCQSSPNKDAPRTCNTVVLLQPSSDTGWERDIGVQAGSFTTLVRLNASADHMVGKWQDEEEVTTTTGHSVLLTLFHSTEKACRALQHYGTSATLEQHWLGRRIGVQAGSFYDNLFDLTHHRTTWLANSRRGFLSSMHFLRKNHKMATVCAPTKTDLKSESKHKLVERCSFNTMNSSTYQTSPHAS